MAVTKSNDVLYTNVSPSWKFDRNRHTYNRWLKDSVLVIDAIKATVVNKNDWKWFGRQKGLSRPQAVVKGRVTNHRNHHMEQAAEMSTYTKQLSRATAFPTRLHMRPAKMQIRLRIRAVWSESPLSTWRCLETLATHRVPCEDSDRTARMRRLIWVFSGRTCNLVGNAVPSTYYMCRVTSRICEQRVFASREMPYNFWIQQFQLFTKSGELGSWIKFE